jgi:hypothetical protein
VEELQSKLLLPHTNAVSKFVFSQKADNHFFAYGKHLCNFQSKAPEIYWTIVKRRAHLKVSIILLALKERTF